MIKIYNEIGLGLKKLIFPIKSLACRALLKNICCCLIILLPTIASAQTVVTGTVKDNKGAAVIAATVTEKGVANSTITDADGNFKIPLKGQSGILVITSVGYKPQEVPVGSKNKVFVTLEEDQSKLNEVVVVGYGSVKKSDLTGSVSSIKGSELNLGGTVSNVAQAIQGKAAGVLVQQTNFAPGGGIAVTIRGGNSINASNEPLYVVDGFISDYGNLINPNDIADIQILKDASATAIYGSRGANGVVLITTKRGKPGTQSVNFENYYGTQTSQHLYKMMNATQFATYLDSVTAQNNRLANTTVALPYTSAQIGSLGAGTNWEKAV